MFLDIAKKKLVDSQIVYQQLFTHQVNVLSAYKLWAEKKDMANDDPVCMVEAFESLAHKYFPMLQSTSPPAGAWSKNFLWDLSGYSLSVQGIHCKMAGKSSKYAWFFCFCTELIYFEVGSILRLGAHMCDLALVEKYLEAIEDE